MITEGLENLTGSIGEARLPDIIGFIGVWLYLIAYAALQLGIFRGPSYTYTLLNLAAASAILISLSSTFNLSAAMVQISWILISLVGLIRLYLINRPKRLSEAEDALCRRLLPDTPTRQAHAFLGHGEWHHGEPGTILIREGEPIDALVYLHEGEASVSFDQHTINGLGPGDLIGEMTVLTGEPATATVTLSKPSRYFCIDAVKLRRKLASRHELARIFERSLSMEINRKLRTMSHHTARHAGHLAG